MSLPAEVEALLRSRIRDVPDWPLHGVVFKDIGPLLGDPMSFRAAVEGLAQAFGADPVDKVAGIEARGFVLGAPVAVVREVGFVPVRKAGKLPGDLVSASYSLEYGTASVEVQADAFSPGDRILIVDDVLATGGTGAAAVDLVRRAGGVVVGFAVLIELEFLAGRDQLAGVPVRSLLQM